MNQYLRVANQLSDPVIFLTSLGNIVGINRAAYRHLKYHYNELLGKELSSVSTNNQQDISNYLKACSRTREPIVRSITLITRDTEQLTYRTYGALLAPPSTDNPATVMLRFTPKDNGVVSNLLQNQKIDELSREVAAHKRLEESLKAAYEQQYHIAEVLQRSLLQIAPADAFPGMEFATFYKPAWTEARIGGDFYDVFSVDDNHVALVVADVTGKGLQSAAYTAEVKYTLRTLIREHLLPDIALKRLNDFLVANSVDQSQIEKYVSAAVVVVDLSTGDALIAAAASEPPLIVRSNGMVETVNVSGVVLGALSSIEYHSVTIKLDDSDLLFMVTDGITEARNNDGVFLEYEGFVNIALSSRYRFTLEDIGKFVLDKTMDFAGGRLQDDACILIARLR